MNKKGFTLIELIAVIVIMAIIALIATPNIVNMVDKANKEEYLANAKEIISRASAMEKKGTEKLDKTEDNTFSLKLQDIEGIPNDYKDPYGFIYDKENSKVVFEYEEKYNQRTVTILLISKSEEENSKDCYILKGKSTEINAERVTKGTINDDKCE